MRIVERILIHATPESIWQILADVEHWPNWTPTVLRVEPLTQNGLAVGARYRVTQPKLRPGVYEVTECHSLISFTWAQKMPGAAMNAVHRLTSGADGTEAELSFEVKGLLGGIIGRMYGKIIADYVRTEAQSLKAHCENPTTGP